MRDRDERFHREWLGLAQPIEGLVLSVPVLADAQIAPPLRAELTVRFKALLEARGEGDATRWVIPHLATFLRDFLGFDRPGMVVPRAELPTDLSFYAPEGGQEIRPSLALGRGPFTTGDPFADFDAPATAPGESGAPSPYWALVWDLTEDASEPLDLDRPEAVTGPWRYPPTAKLERLLRHSGIPIGLLFNGTELRLLYAPAAETSAHLTFRVNELREPAGLPLLTALALLLSAERAYSAAPEHTLEGLLAESRRRQADVTEALAEQVFEAVEILVAGFEAAAQRDAAGGRLDWLRPALEQEGDHFYQGVLSVVLRLVFLLYAEDQSLLPVGHPSYAAHLSVGGLHDRLSEDAGNHPESMAHRFGAYGQLLALFRAVFFGIQHGELELPPRRGRLFDPNSYPFLEGGQPEWTAAVGDPAARASAQPPSVDDGTLERVLRRLIVFQGQRLSYRTLDVEQIGSVYESLMGYHVLRLESPAVRIGKHGVWVEAHALSRLSPTERAKLFKEDCGLNPGPAAALEKAIAAAKKNEAAVLEALRKEATGKKAALARHEAGAGRLVLQPGEERRRTGSHYTPRSLTEKVVARTLEPLLSCLGPDRSAEQILQLKICDPAMGSGAFLVAACRALASEIVTAWTRSSELAAIVEQHRDAHLHARRLVAQRCLYGVDKNPAAVELAKLSLWLITLSDKLPFTFVDHALRHGDSLVGLDFKQIAAFHWAPDKHKQLETCQALLQDALDQAIDLRHQIQALAGLDDPATQADKRRLFEFSQQAIARIRLVADVCVGAFFAEGKDAARERERTRRLDLVTQWIARPEQDPSPELSDIADRARRELSPFHWWIEFPEVFFEERPDPLQGGVKNGAALMEGVVGNPPFGGKNNIGGSNAAGYLDWLKAVSPGAHGNSDLSAHFFRRASRLLGQHGAFGLIATNTIAQGDTRATALKPLVDAGWHLFDATPTLAWPGAAAVTVSLVHGAHGRAAEVVVPTLDGRPVSTINSRLKPTPERADPVQLLSNASSSYQGSVVLGMGFTLTPQERDELIKKSKRNAERIFPYLGGEEVNTSPTQDFERYVISFGQMELSEAERWPDLIAIVREKVKPERDNLKDNADGLHRKKHWWQFGRWTPALYAAIAPLKRCLVTACVSKHLMFSFQPADRIFSHKLYVFPLDHFTAFAVLQSRVHVAWAWLLSSTMKTDLNYSASDCFETFPFPSPDPRATHPALERAGEALYQARAAFMLATQQGLTKTYNALKDPASDDPRILALRQLHEELDQAVLAAYGWHDLSVPPYCAKTPADKAAQQSFEDEIIDRLYVLNAERAREEQRLGAGSGAKKGKAPAKGKGTANGKKGAGKPGQGDLF